MSLDAEIRSVARSLPSMDESQRAFFVEAFFGMLSTMPELDVRIVAEAQKRWPVMSTEQWSALRDAFWSETARRDAEAYRVAQAQRERERIERQEREAARRAAHEASAIVVELPRTIAPKMTAWSRYDHEFGQVGQGQHLVMPAGYGPREVNSLRAYLKRHFPRLAVSTRANSLGNETYVYKKEPNQ